MITHYLYHVPGRKIGCTKNLEKRKTWYRRREGGLPAGFEFLTELHDKTDREAGDIEALWNRRFGYKYQTHYTHTQKMAQTAGSFVSMTFEQRSAGGRKGGRIGGPIGARRYVEVTTPEQRSKNSSVGGRKAAELGVGATALSRERKIEIGQAAAKSPAHNTRKLVACPHCGKIGAAFIMSRWHFDNCRLAPTLTET